MGWTSEENKKNKEFTTKVIGSETGGLVCEEDHARVLWVNREEEYEGGRENMSGS